MKILLINEVCGRTSTGRICAEIAAHYEAAGHKVKIAYGRNRDVPAWCEKYAVRIGNDFSVYAHALYTRLLDRHGFGSRSATKRFVIWAENYNPDMIWLHNLHGYYLNMEILFGWLKKKTHAEIRWTLHDCWPITGHCAFFSAVRCEKWKTGCFQCPQRKEYPKSLFLDYSEKNFRKKRELFTGIKNMTVIVPSNWLADIAGQSILREYPIRVQYHKIDRNIFYPAKSRIREIYHLSGKKIILGVANVWEKRKGLDDFTELARMLDESFAVLLVGLSRKQIKKLPANIIGLERTADAEVLAGLYSASDIYINASREETFGMTTLEAISCGTKVIVYKGTACEEILKQYENCGLAVEPGAENLKKGIRILLKDAEEKHMRETVETS